MVLGRDAVAVHVLDSAQAAVRRIWHSDHELVVELRLLDVFLWFLVLLNVCHDS